MIQGSYRNRGMGHSFDWKLVICYLLLVFIGWINIYASVHSSDPASIFDWSVRSGKQFVWILTAFGLAGLILFVIPPRLWESAALPMYLGVLVLLVAVIFLGVEVKGSRSWFAFGPVRFQPAEVSKITTSLLLAFIMSRPGYKISRTKDFLVTAAVIILPMLIIVAESETGSALVYVGFIFMLYREGLSGWLLTLIGVAIILFILTLTASSYVSVLVLVAILLVCNALNSKKISHNLMGAAAAIAVMALIPMAWEGLAGLLVPKDGPFINGTAAAILSVKPLHILIGGCAAAIPWTLVHAYREKNQFMTLSVAAFVIGVALIFSTDFIFHDVLQDHQRKRIEVLLGMKEDPSGVGYNVNQSMIAIGSGGLTGKGFLQGTQTTFGFGPEQSTDFIFCTVGEEWGFLGCATVILLYVFLIWRILNNAERSRENFTRIYGYCVACCLFMHLFINIGMTIGLMPVIGIPLPLMSYGGSSLWSFTVLISIFIILDHEEKKYF